MTRWPASALVSGALRRIMKNAGPGGLGFCIETTGASGYNKLMLAILALFLAASGLVFGGPLPVESTGAALLYTNYQAPEVPWSIHIVRVARGSPQYELHSRHAGGGVLGLSTLSAQAKAINPVLGRAVAAINGGFYQRDKTYAGVPRGLQIQDGELLHGPTGEPAFWIDGQGAPHTTNVTSFFQVVWPGNVATGIALNDDGSKAPLVLYTPAIGPSTHTSGGRELMLERAGRGPWLPLEIGRTYRARVREVHGGGDSPIAAGILVLSMNQAMASRFTDISTGAVLRISLATFPNLRGARIALSAGPVLLRDGRRQKVGADITQEYEFSSMLEQHPRSAIGWNQDFFFLVEVDGRQKEVSVGMTLDELSRWLLKLGCEDALNLDGGGSATLWFKGQVRNSPCDHYERTIANSLIVVERASAKGTISAAKAQAKE